MDHLQGSGSQHMPAPAPIIPPKELNEHIYELYKPEGDAAMEILFFHGLQFGHSADAYLSTWTTGDVSQQVWPATWLPEVFPHAHIFSIAYDPSVRKTRKYGRLDLHNLAENVMAAILWAGIGQGSCRPVIFVGHCFGGLVIKELCVQADHTHSLGPASERNQKIGNLLQNMGGVIFYGTPHRGSHLADKAAFFLDGPLLDLVTSLSAQSARLEMKFDSVCKKHEISDRIASVGESWATSWGPFYGVVVPEASARCGVDFCTVPADHLSLCKPEKKTSNSFQCLTRFIDRSIKPKTNKTDTGHPHNLVENPEFADGLHNWRAKHCKIYVTESMDGGGILPFTGRRFAVAGNRTKDWQGIEQILTGRIKERTLYNVTGQVRIHGKVTEATVLTTLSLKGMDGRNQYITLAEVQACTTHWTELKGELLVNKLTPQATVYLEGPPGGVDILLDNLAIVIAIREKPAGPPQFQDPKNGVNIVENANLDKGLVGWYPNGKCHLTIASGSPTFLGANAVSSFAATPSPSLTGKFLYTSNRTRKWEGPKQIVTDKIQLFNTYQVTAWVATTLPTGSCGVHTPQKVKVAIKVEWKEREEWKEGGKVYAGTNWTEISGSFRLEAKPEEVSVYIHGPAPGVDVMVAGLHIFAVDRLDRVPFLREQADKVRKCDVVVRLHDSNGHPVPPGTQVAIQQTKNSFPIGTCISNSIFENQGYKKYFLEQFNWAVFENEIKWDWTEPKQGKFRYEEADEMVELCTSNGIPMRGNCILWELEENVQDWLKKLNADDLRKAVRVRVSGLLERYHGKFKHYDVNNEMLHGSFYRDALGAQFWPEVFKLAHKFDPQAALFVNDHFHTSPRKYIEHIQDLKANEAPIGGIGVEGRLTVPVGPIISQALNELGSLRLPIWFTEVEVESTNEHCRADDLEVLFREVYAHPAVEGLMLSGFWEDFDRKNSHLVDFDGRINEAGRRFMTLKKEWLTKVEVVTNEQGQIHFRGFQGDYTLAMEGGGVCNTFTVTKGNGFSEVDLMV